jgi:hypothetical protein
MKHEVFGESFFNIIKWNIDLCVFILDFSLVNIGKIHQKLHASYIWECKQTAKDYEIIHADIRYYTI